MPPCQQISREDDPAHPFLSLSLYPATPGFLSHLFSF